MNIQEYKGQTIGICGVGEKIDRGTTEIIQQKVWDYLDGGAHILIQFENSDVNLIAIEAALEHEAAEEGRVHAIIPGSIALYRQFVCETVLGDDAQHLLGLLDVLETSHPSALIEIKSPAVDLGSFNQMERMFVENSDGIESFLLGRRDRFADPTTLLALHSRKLIGATVS